jgi:hypothetical protein
VADERQRLLIANQLAKSVVREADLEDRCLHLLQSSEAELEAEPEADDSHQALSCGAQQQQQGQPVAVTGTTARGAPVLESEASQGGWLFAVHLIIDDVCQPVIHNFTFSLWRC